MSAPDVAAAATAAAAFRPYRLATRLALLFSGLASLILVLLGFYLSSQLQHAMQAYDRLELGERLAALTEQVRQPTADSKGALSQALAQHTFGRPRMLMWVMVDGAPLAATTAQQPPVQSGQSTLTDAAGEPLYLIVERRPAALADGRPAELVAAVDHDMPQSYTRRFVLNLVAGFAVAIVLIALLAGFSAWLATAPLRAVARQAGRIDPTQLHHRLADTGLPLEIVPLVRAFNGALDRVEEGYRRLETFNADIAHELRTPLQNMIGQAEVALSRARSASEYAEVLRSLLEEADHLRRMAADMLFITSADGGALETEPIDIAKEFELVLGYFEASADERGLRLQSQGTGSLVANRGLVRRALTNLVDNALKYGAAGSTVVVQAFEEDGALALAVRNQGSDIPAPLLPRLFDRFVRGELSRAGEGGAGLGLAIVRTIMQRHGGSVGVTSLDGRTEFKLRFPR
jgi:two-component system, OmpR family, heavy metal sensor histidine kinase CusS